MILTNCYTALQEGSIFSKCHAEKKYLNFSYEQCDIDNVES